MRRKSKYRLPSARQSSNGGFLWLLVAVAFAALAWVWWNAGKIPQKAPPKKFAPLRATNAPAAPAFARTNVVSRGVVLSTNGGFPRIVQTALEAQIAMDRRGISCGSLDGRIGSQTRAAIRAFQQASQIPVTGELDAATKSRLILFAPPLGTYIVTTNDLARLQPLNHTWLGKSRQTALDYESVLELVAEQSHAHPTLIRNLNPAVNWASVAAGCSLLVPDAARAEPATRASFVQISLADKTLEAFDEQTNLLAHFPCSIARRVEKRPAGELHVSAIAPNPNYTFDPEIFPESVEAQQIKTKLLIPPGPNNPVGVVWIGLDKPGYGMHGTPVPEAVGRTESHGCFRLANWNAEYLLKLVWVGMPVVVR